MDDYEEIHLGIIAMTADALLLNDGDFQKWIPLSTIKNARNDWEVGQGYTMVVKVWKLKEAGFI